MFPRRIPVFAGLIMMTVIGYAGMPWNQAADRYSWNFMGNAGEQAFHNRAVPGYTTDSLNMRMVGYYGLAPTPSTLSLHGSYIYLDAFQGFVVYDIGTNPEKPRRVNTVNVGPWALINLLSRGNYLYVSQGHGGIFTYDITDPVNPKLVDRYVLDAPKNMAWLSRLIGDVLCVTARDFSDLNAPVKLLTFSLADPAHPTKTGELELPKAFWQYINIEEAGGNKVVIGGQYPYMYLVDISNPSSPHIEAECSFSNDPSVTMISFCYDSLSSTLYTCQGSQAAYIKTYNMSDFSSPSIIDSIPGVANWLDILNKDTLMQYFMGLSPQEDTLFFNDVSDPGSPLQIGSYNGVEIDRPDGIVFKDEYIYGCGVFGGFHVADRSNLANIKDIWSGKVGMAQLLSISASVNNRFFASSMALDITATKFESYIYPFTVLSTGEIATADSSNFNLMAQDLFYRSNLLVASDRQSDELLFYDVSATDSPLLLNSISMDNPRRIFSDGNKLFIAQTNGISVVDISDPTKPVVKDSLYIFGKCRDVCEKGGIVYVAGANFLSVYRSLNNKLEEIHTLALATEGLAVEVSGTMLYLSRGDALDIFDITDPTSPTLLGTAVQMLEGTNDDIEVAGDRVFVASNEEILSFDVSNPASPTLAGYFIIPPGCIWYGDDLRQRLRTYGNYLYWSTVAYGICVIDPYGDAEMVAEPASETSSPLPLDLEVSRGQGQEYTVRYTLPAQTGVNISVYDASGRMVRVLRAVRETAGTHLLTWDAGGVSSGVYFVRLATAAGSVTAKLLVLD